MEGMKGKIFTANLASIRQCYEISKEVDLLAANINDTPQSSKLGCIYNESMFKVEVKLSFEFDISETLNVFKVAPNSWKIIQASQSKENGWGCRTLRGGDNLPNSMKDWKPQLFFAKLVGPSNASREWGILTTWQTNPEKLPQ
ncbi:hypothetical protein ACLOJK_032223 [Asimina triloba]